ncbi:MAG: hypothetical protein LBI13_04200 [Streptococcaceae bacterium]|jgi:hypothetical protein|nr:hypothetical protein [Streptococcaceae bacterium]
MNDFVFDFYKRKYEQLISLYNVIELRKNVRRGVDIKLLELNQRYLTLEAFTIFEKFVQDFINQCALKIEQDDDIKTFADLYRGLINEVIPNEEGDNKKIIDFLLQKPRATHITGNLSFHHFTYDSNTNSFDKNTKTGKYVSYLLNQTGDYFMTFKLKGYKPNLIPDQQRALGFLSYYSGVHRHKLAHGNVENYTVMDFQEFKENMGWFLEIIAKVFQDYNNVYF